MTIKLEFKDEKDLYNKLNEIKKKSMQKWKDGADRGTAVHDYIQSYAEGKKPTLSEDIGIAKFVKVEYTVKKKADESK